MRVFVVVAVLALMLAMTLVVRSRQGWAPTPVEREAILCDRGSAPNCTSLGHQLVTGTGVPRDTREGMARLEQGCQLLSGPGCYLRGYYALELEVEGAESLAADAFQRGCRRAHADSCAYGGWLKRNARTLPRDVQAGTDQLWAACAKSSAMGCLWRGEAVFDRAAPYESELAASAKAFSRACQLGEANGCLREAQALACGRGLPREPERALGVVRRLCARGVTGACEQQVLLEPDGGLAAAGPALEQVIVHRVLVAAQSGDPAGARLGLQWLDGGPTQTLLLAALEAHEDRLDEATARLATLPRAEPAPEVAVLRGAIAARRAGQPWPEALWVGWGEAGRPDLHHPKWLPPSEDPLPDAYRCDPRREEPGAVASEDAFVKVFAQTGWNRYPLDRRLAPELVHAALRFSTSDDPAVRLIALTVVSYSSGQRAGDAALQLEVAARRALALTRSDSLFFQLLQTPSGMKAGAAHEEDLLELERWATLPLLPPHQLVFERFRRVLGRTPQAEAEAFQATVGVMCSLIDFTNLPGWLARGDLEPKRRAALLHRLGVTVASGGWLVDLYVGASLQRAGSRLSVDPAFHASLKALEARTAALRTGPHGLQAVGNWPFDTLSDGSAAPLIEHEVELIERLQALAAEKP